MRSNTTTSTVTLENEIFTIGSYIGISILTQNKDGYINATKLIYDINQQKLSNTQLRQYLGGEKWSQIVNYLIRMFSYTSKLDTAKDFLNSITNTKTIAYTMT
jgi:hypothetical protein